MGEGAGRQLQWLACVADDPRQCRAIWRNNPRKPYLLQAGRLFDVVVIGGSVAIETYDRLRLQDLLFAPVMADWGGRRLGFFLPPASRSAFDQAVRAGAAEPPGYRYLGPGSYVVVPGPRAISSDRYEWLRAPAPGAPEEAPASVGVLASVLLVATAVIARADRYGGSPWTRHFGAPASGSETPSTGTD